MRFKELYETNTILDILSILKEDFDWIKKELSREEFNKTNDKEFIKEYVKVNNELAQMFEDVEEFEKWFNRNVRWAIKYTVPILDKRIDYLKKFHQDDWDDFILETYVDLKKKFKNVIPTKVLRYGK